MLWNHSFSLACSETMSGSWGLRAARTASTPVNCCHSARSSLARALASCNMECMGRSDSLLSGSSSMYTAPGYAWRMRFSTSFSSRSTSRVTSSAYRDRSRGRSASSDPRSAACVNRPR